MLDRVLAPSKYAAEQGCGDKCTQIAASNFARQHGQLPGINHDIMGSEQLFLGLLSRWIASISPE